jgi:hypothetical protein
MDKQTTLKQVEDGFNELLAAIDGADEATMSEVFYGTWCLKDLLGHIAGWQYVMMGSMERMARGERPTPEGVDYSDADAWNAKFASVAHVQNGTTVIADLRQSFANYLRAARAIPDDRYGEGKTINKLLEGSGSGHYREHIPAIRAYRSKG